jgi:hypothetical protein
MLCYTFNYTFGNVLEVKIMSRSRPTSNPISYHKNTKQYYVTKGGKRIYLGSDKDRAINRHHRLGLGIKPIQEENEPPLGVTIKDLANRFIVAQKANWRNPETTLKCYKDWLGRFIKDHPKTKTSEVTVGKFAMWKLSLKERSYSVESINHYLVAVRAMCTFAEDTAIIRHAPKLKRVKNEPRPRAGTTRKQLYTLDHLKRLLGNADLQIKLDGHRDEAQWSNARVESDFIFPWQQRTAPATDFRALCDEDYFYFAFRVMDADLFVLADLPEEGYAVFENRVEMYFARDEKMQNYYWIEMGPQGRTMD